MNALATDQASRFAKTIASDPQLHGKVTVGLFVGDSEIEPSKKCRQKRSLPVSTRCAKARRTSC